MSFSERIDEDPSAETDDERLRVEAGEHGTYKIYRERYCLVEFETDAMAEDGEGFERYDWSTDDSFILQSENQAQQAAQQLRKAGAFDPNKLFFRQREYDDPEE